MERLKKERKPSGVTGFTGKGNHRPGFTLEEFSREGEVYLPSIPLGLSELNRNAVDWINNGGYNPPVPVESKDLTEIFERILASLK